MSDRIDTPFYVGTIEGTLKNHTTIKCPRCGKAYSPLGYCKNCLYGATKGPEKEILNFGE